MKTKKQVRLSDREHKVGTLMMKGHRNKKIALMLELNEPTISTYVQRMSVKAGLSIKEDRLNIYAIINKLNELSLLDPRVYNDRGNTKK
jgi:DNA-binding NarL/FixJ family response regulator